jgi:hypothetical protein
MGNASSRRLVVHLSAMPNAVDANDAKLVPDFVEHPVVSDANPPFVAASNELAAAVGARVATQVLNGGNQAPVQRPGETVEFSARRPIKTLYTPLLRL